MAAANKVTRIKASDDAPKAAKKATDKATKATKAAKVTTPVKSPKRGGNPIWNYFKGAWVELRQVRWPNRKATWSLTLAVIVFSLFFVLLILLLDMFFKYVFELIIT